MQLTVKRSDFLRELEFAQSVAETKTTTPVLSHLLLEATKAGANITATDLQLSMRTSCTATTQVEGACAIPARRLFDYVKLLPETDIAIKLLENNWVSVRAGRSNTKMTAMAKTNYPSITSFPAAALVTISAATLKMMISRTLFAVSSEESRYTLSGALLVLASQSLTMAATDGHRLAHIRSAEADLGVSQEHRLLIPRQAMQTLLGLLQRSNCETVDLAEDEATLFFRVGSRVFTSRKLSGTFPNYEAVLPKNNPKLVTVDCDQFAVAIQRVSQFADKNSQAIRLKLENNEMRLFASSADSGEAEEVVETAFTHEPLVIGFNAEYLEDFLRQMPKGGQVQLELKDGQSAGLLKPVAGKDDKTNYQYIVMPMRC